MVGEEEKVSKAEFVMYVKGVNGDLDDIKTAVATLTDNINRRFDALDIKLTQERQEGREAHQRLHDRVDATNLSFATEMVGVGEAVNGVREGFGEELGKIQEGHVSKSMTAFIAFLSSLSLALIAVVLTMVLK